ncbi:HD family hydrolase [Aquimarina sp. W85]|uniref:HD domain-containing protein n=1 Tax=Aquimarina rhodophyticola TaxID=3342246 RepID=UPI00366E8B66
MSNTRLNQQLRFIFEIDNLKSIIRQSALFNSNRRENDAEHSWHLAMMVLVLAEHASHAIDITRVLKMVLIHDLVEIDAGDTFLFDTHKSHTNTHEEMVAAQRIFKLLPEDIAADFMELWNEFERGESTDARFAKAIDRLHPALQNLSNDGGTWAKFEIERATILDKLQPIEKGSTVLWEYIKNEITSTYQVKG